MIAEIHRKISKNGSNLNERSEDNLTGDFFGTMRYIPFNQGMKSILKEYIYPHELANTIEKINADFWNENIDFWPYDEEGEIDVLINLAEVVIGIEVKFLSGLSSDDSICNEKATYEDDIEQIMLESRQQLARESRIISKKVIGKDKLLIFIADENDCMAVYQDTISRNILEKNVQLGILSWQDILTAIKNINTENSFQQLMLSDLKELLITKGFESFHNFDLGGDILVEDSLFYKFKGRIFSFNIEDEVREMDFYEFGRKHSQCRDCN